jgi:putative transposase
MANTYTQIYIHVVFAVEGRQNLIQPQHNDQLQKYITGIVSSQKQKLIAINNMPDHLHMLVGLKPDTSLSDLVRDVKANSSRFINEKRWIAGRFSWQQGFGAFSHSLSHGARGHWSQKSHRNAPCAREKRMANWEKRLAKLWRRTSFTKKAHAGHGQEPKWEIPCKSLQTKIMKTTSQKRGAPACKKVAGILSSFG